MCVMGKSRQADPIARLSLVQRVVWHRRERRIVDQFRRDQIASLKLVQGKRLLGAMIEHRDAIMAATEECWLTIRGVSDEARRALLDISHHRCHIDGVGRYRDSWWIALRSDSVSASPLARIVVLASHVTVSETTI